MPRAGAEPAQPVTRFTCPTAEPAASLWSRSRDGQVITHGVLPTNPVIIDPGNAAVSDQVAEREPQHQLLEPPPDRSGNLRAADPRAGRHDLFHSLSPRPLVGGESNGYVCMITQRLCKYHRVLQGHRRALTRTRRRRVCGVSDDHHPTAGPCRHMAQVVVLSPASSSRPVLTSSAAG